MFKGCVFLLTNIFYNEQNEKGFLKCRYLNKTQKMLFFSGQAKTGKIILQNNKKNGTFLVKMGCIITLLISDVLLADRCSK